ncbi:uncharacterized protein [Haliotis asinina]|uniref:uncharacterized protein n=1 Tax=Haliotis asinina TaxID=109174 RepID=UPI003531FC1A
METYLEFTRRTSDSDESDDSTISSRYSSEGEVPLPKYDDRFDPDDPEPGFQTSGDALLSSIVSTTEQTQILRKLSATESCLQHLDAGEKTPSTRHVFPTCSLCQQQFTLKDPAPYLLPCLHAVCETCVTSAAGGEMTCSTCQRQVNLNDRILQKDAVRQKEIFHLTARHRPGELLCTHEDDGNQAVCWCQQCEEFLCEYCQTMHSSIKVSREHVLQDIIDLVPTVSNIPTFCSTHEHDSLYLFDKSCQKLICARCRLSDHANHDVEELDVVADAITKQLRLYKDALSTLQNRQQLNIKSVKKGREFTQRMHTFWKETISHTFQTLRSQLGHSEKEFLFDLERQSEEANATQHALLNTFENDGKTCTGVLDYIDKILLYGSKLDILAMEGPVRDMTQTFQDTARSEIHDSPPALCSNSMSKLKSITSGFATLFTRQSVKDADAQTDDVYKADMEMKHKIVIAELRTKMDSDEKHIEMLNAQIRSLQMRIEEKEAIEDRTVTTIDFLLDADAQTDDVYKADMEMKHKIVIAELRTKMDSDEKHIEMLNAQIRSLQMRIEEKEAIEDRTVTTIDFLLGVAREGVVHKLNTGPVDRSMLLKCTPLKYDKDRANLDYVHINTEGDLVNRKSRTRSARVRRLKRYMGTCSSFPLPQDGCPQYWEVENRVSLDKPLPENGLILEIGVCREEERERDVHYCISERPYSYSMVAIRCTRHDGICIYICKEGKCVLHLPDTLSNTAGASHTSHYGVVYDDARKKIVFIDVKEKKVMSTLDNVDSTEALWPMFAVYNPSVLAVSMRLVVSSDINMTGEKKAMIVKALS